MKDTARGTATTQPAGSVEPQLTLDPGIVEITIVKLSPDGGGAMYAHCQYPCGYIHEHQVNLSDELVAQVETVLRSRYKNIGIVNVHQVPALSTGSVIKLEV